MTAVVLVNGPAIRRARERLGRTPRELARVLHCDRTWITRLEIGTARQCSRAFFHRLVEALAVPDEGRALRLNPDDDAVTPVVPDRALPEQTGGEHDRAQPEPAGREVAR